MNHSNQPSPAPTSGLIFCGVLAFFVTFFILQLRGYVTVLVVGGLTFLFGAIYIFIYNILNKRK